MANYAETSKNFSGQFMTGIEGVNTGIIIPWSSASIPSGFLECNGQSVSQATYAALFAVIGTTYGNPGGGNFNVPDLTDRTVVNKSNTKSLAQTGGANTVAPTGNLSATISNTTVTTAQMPAHSHTGTVQMGGNVGGMSGSGQITGGSTSTSNTGGGGAHGHAFSGTFTGENDSVLQPYLVLVYIIKT